MHVWKVARYTCSSPFYFGECDNYVDTSVMCKNLCGIGLEKILTYYEGFQQNSPDPVTMVVSLGDGILPAQQLGFADSSAAYYLSGQPKVNPRQLLELFQNVVALYSNAAVSSNTIIFIVLVLASISVQQTQSFFPPILIDLSE